MTKNKRHKAPSLSSRDAFDKAIDDLARITVTLRKLEAERDHAIQLARNSFAASIAETAARAEVLGLLVEKYAEEHRAEIFPTERKSAETALATFGFRLGQPTLALLNRSWTWEKVTTALQTSTGVFKECVRQKFEADKEKMKSTLSERELATVGCKIAQAETFFVEPKDQPKTEARVA